MVNFRNPQRDSVICSLRMSQRWKCIASRCTRVRNTRCVVRDYTADVEDTNWPGGPSVSTVDEFACDTDGVIWEHIGNILTENTLEIEVSLVSVYSVVLDKWITHNCVNILGPKIAHNFTNLVIYVFCVTPIKEGSFCSALVWRMRHELSRYNRNKGKGKGKVISLRVLCDSEFG